MEFKLSEYKLKMEDIGFLSYQEHEMFNSTILVEHSINKTLIGFLNEYKTIRKVELLYRASVDGFESANFHKKCDNIANTVSIVRSSNGNVFGGFTTQSWDGLNCYKRDADAFIFSLINQENIAKKILVKPSECHNAIYCYPNYGPDFGSGHGFFVENMANTKNCTSKLPSSYNYNGAIDGKIYLAGSQLFTVSEVEVFSLTFE